MLRKVVKIRFLEFSPLVPVEERVFYKLLSRHYDIDQVSSPDYIITNGFREHVNYDGCVKILLNGENVAPDFNSFDYVTGFDHLAFGDRYLRSPLFAHYTKAFDLCCQQRTMTDEQLLQRKFCSFVVSNGSCADPIRDKFFKRLSQYKKVDSGGRWMNNVGGAVNDKLGFCRDHKFNIAFENSSYDGYTTEKILEAYAAGSVPIYFGNPTVETDFRPESMIRIKSDADIERAVEEVVRLDNDDEAYLAKCHERCFSVPDPLVYERELEDFLVHIIEQPLESAKRRAFYGMQSMVRYELRRKVAIDRGITRFADAARKIGLFSFAASMFRKVSGV